MSIVYHERPGVYSDYTASSVSASGERSKVLALIGVSDAEVGLYTVTSYSDGAAAFGDGSELGKMLAAAYKNGAGTVLAYSIAEDTAENYQAAIDAVMAEKAAAFCAVGSVSEAVQQMLKRAVLEASASGGECIGIVGLNAPEKNALLARAAALDCERMVLVGPDAYRSGESELCGGAVCASSLCGLLAAQTDPALPLNGAVVSGLSGVSASYDDTEIDALVQGGVTVLTAVAGTVRILRGITTRQTIGEGRDTTYRELNTILVIDDVIPGVRSALGARFPRAKNNAATRSAIRSQVIVELDSRVSREIIDSYSDVTVEASSTDASTCLVSFSFTVMRGLNRIWLTAHISV